MVKATGKSFFFSTTHLDPYSVPARLSRWNEIISMTTALKGSLPVVSTGDFNTSKYSDYADTYLPRMKSNGYGDVVDQTANKNTVSPARAESTYRAWVNSYSGFRRDVSRLCLRGQPGQDRQRRRLDLRHDSVQVKGWEVVVNIGRA